MGVESKISWTDHTYNPWIGCTKVSEGCANCYAEGLMDERLGEVEWGDEGTRKETKTSAASFRRLQRRQADELELLGDDASYIKPLVFCASLSDFFEDRPDLVAPRKRAFDTFSYCDLLHFLLLTKRPENIPRLVSGAFSNEEVMREALHNITFGTSVENQKRWDERVKIMASLFRNDPPVTPVVLLSAEPMLGPIDAEAGLRALNDLGMIPWVVCGGESGRNARPFRPVWALQLKRATEKAGGFFHFKQTGENVWDAGNRLHVEGKGTDPAAWPAELRERSRPAFGLHQRLRFQRLTG